MNDERRADLRAIIRKAEDIRNYICDLDGSILVALSEEEDAYDSMGPGLQATQRGLDSEAALEALNAATDSCAEMYDSLNALIDTIEEVL